jgi:hypothetical protein
MYPATCVAFLIYQSADSCSKIIRVFSQKKERIVMVGILVVVVLVLLIVFLAKRI